MLAEELFSAPLRPPKTGRKLWTKTGTHLFSSHGHAYQPSINSICPRGIFFLASLIPNHSPVSTSASNPPARVLKGQDEQGKVPRPTRAEKQPGAQPVQISIPPLTPPSSPAPHSTRCARDDAPSRVCVAVAGPALAARAVADRPLFAAADSNRVRPTPAS